MDYDMVERGYKAQKDFLKGINVLIQFEEEKKGKESEETPKGENPKEEKNSVTTTELNNLKLFMRVQTEAVNTILKLLDSNKEKFEELKKKAQEKQREENRKKAEEYNKAHPVKTPIKPAKPKKEMEECMESLFGDWESESDKKEDAEK